MKKIIILILILTTTITMSFNSYADDMVDTDIYDSTIKNITISNKDTINLKNNTLKLTYKKCESIKIIGNNNLRKIELSHIIAKKIRISKCSKIEKVEIYDTKSNEVKINKCNNLKLIDTETDKIIKKLIVEKNNKLKKLSTFPSYNKVAQVRIKKLKSLKNLSVSGATIKSIDLSKYHKLKYVDLSYCKIKRIKFGKKNIIREIDLSHNNIKKISIKYFKKAFKIDLSYNKISGCLLLPKMIKADANKINCSNNKIKHIKSPKNSNLWILCCNHNKLKTIDLNNACLDILESKKNPGVRVFYASINRKRGDKSTKYIKKYKERY